MACSYPQATPQDIQAVLAKELEETGDEEFPYRLPKVRRLEILVVSLARQAGYDGNRSAL